MSNGKFNIVGSFQVTINDLELLNWLESENNLNDLIVKLLRNEMDKSKSEKRFDSEHNNKKNKLRSMIDDDFWNR